VEAFSIEMNNSSDLYTLENPVYTFSQLKLVNASDKAHQTRRLTKSQNENEVKILRELMEQDAESKEVVMPVAKVAKQAEIEVEDVRSKRNLSRGAGSAKASNNACVEERSRKRCSRLRERRIRWLLRHRLFSRELASDNGPRKEIPFHKKHILVAVSEGTCQYLQQLD